MGRTIARTIAGVAAALALCGAVAAASADATSAATRLRICENRWAFGFHTKVWAIGRTSCPFASAVADSAFGYGSGEAFRRTMRVRSPVTGRRYTLHRVYHRHRGRIVRAEYRGTGANDSLIGARVWQSWPF